MKMKQLTVSRKDVMWIICVALLLIFSAVSSGIGVPLYAQATATSTNTPTATYTPTRTATPVATALPMGVSLSGGVSGVRVGTYGLTFDTTGDGLQIAGGNGISTYSSAGKQTFHVSGATGKITGTGMEFGTQATYTSGATIAHTLGVTPTMCLIWPSRETTATLTLGPTTFSSDMSSTANPIYWMCAQ